MATQRGASADARWATDSVASFVLFVVHESLHHFQLQKFAPLPTQASPLANQTAVRPHRALVGESLIESMLERERALLASAIEAPSCSTAADTLQHYRRARLERLRRLPAVFVGFEDAHERAEGLATWIGLLGVHQLMTRDTSGARRDVVSDLREGYRDSSGRPFEGWARYASWHLYATGAGKAALLDRCAASSWRVAVTSGETLESLLAEIAPLPGAPPNERRRALLNPRSPLGVTRAPIP